MMSKIITVTTNIQPIIQHIQELQDKLKSLNAELKQYKELLQFDYMFDAEKLISLQGRTLAQIVISSTSSLDKERFSVEAPKEFTVYESYIVKKPTSYLKVS